MSDFEQLKKEVNEITQKKWEALRQFHIYEKKLTEVNNLLRKTCVEKHGSHNMERDQEDYDFHTHYICTRCGEYR
jgi:hypothetical protein